jgi:hypothetical protein
MQRQLNRELNVYRVEHCSDVYVDACVRNEAGILVFLSVYGRDTAIKELLARMQLGSGANGLKELTLKGHGDHEGESHRVTVGNANELDKLTGRLPKCLYGVLTHTWIFDPAIRAPDKGAGQAWIIEPTVEDRRQLRETVQRRIWNAVCELASIPLLPHWCDVVLDAMGPTLITQMGITADPDVSRTASHFISKPLGNLVAFRVHLDDTFPSRISTLIQQGKLHLEPQALPALLKAA